jgi:hypothetical protein
VSYSKLCICSGVRPKLLGTHRNIIGLRDMDSVQQLSARLATARRVVVVGNGGIALELVHEVTCAQFLNRTPLMYFAVDFL